MYVTGVGLRNNETCVNLIRYLISNDESELCLLEGW